MSSSQQARVSAASLHTSDTPINRGAYKLKDQSDPQAHNYHTLEEVRAAETEVDFPTEPVEYEEFVRSDSHVRAESADGRQQQNGSSNLTPAEYEQFTPAQGGGRKPAQTAYQPLQIQTRPKPGIYMNATQTPADSGVYEAVSKTNTTPSSTTQVKHRSEPAPQDYRLQTPYVQVEGTPKKHLPVKIALVCVGMLVLVVLTTIATAALVLALTTGRCECRDDDIDEALRLANENFNRLEELDPEGVTGSLRDGFTSIISANQDDIGKNAELITANTEELILALEQIWQVNNTLINQIRNLRNTQGLSNTEDCATTVVTQCTITANSDNGMCNTGLVELKVDGQITTGFTCFTMGGGNLDNPPMATTGYNEAEEVARCRCDSRDSTGLSPVGTNTEITCGLAVTRCSLRTEGDA